MVPAARLRPAKALYDHGYRLLRISAPKGSLVLLVVLDYPPNYQYETDWYQKKTYITADDFFEWKWYNHCYCKD